MKYAYTKDDTNKLVASGWEILEHIPWRINGIYCVTVARDRAWYKGTEELRVKFWESVALARNGSFQAVEGKKKVIVTKEPACLIQD